MTVLIIYKSELQELFCIPVFPIILGKKVSPNCNDQKYRPNLSFHERSKL